MRMISSELSIDIGSNEDVTLGETVNCTKRTQSQPRTRYGSVETIVPGSISYLTPS